MSLRTDIMQVLRSPNCRHVNFAFGSLRVSGSGYGTVADRIANRQIQVVQSSTMPSTLAAYNRRFNCFVVGAAPSRSLIVHEATHAMSDLRRARISDVDDECCAYTAEMVFALLDDPGLRARIEQPAARAQFTRNIGRTVQQCRTEPGLCNTAVIGEATLIALDILARRRVNAETLRALREVLDRDPQTHRDPARTVRVYDGISRATIPADYLSEVGGTVIND